MKNLKTSSEYTKLCSELKDLDIQREKLQNKKRSLEASGHFDLKKTKRNTYQADKTQVKITHLFKQTPNQIAHQIVKEIISLALAGVIRNINQSKPTNDFVIDPILQSHSDASVRRVKCTYSVELKQEVVKRLRQQGIVSTFLYYNRRIPRSTLHSWGKAKKIVNGLPGAGRKTQLALLEEDFFDWFLVARARKIPVRDEDLCKKALIFAKRLLADVQTKLSETERQAYIEFAASKGWLDKFKTRHKICSRFVTTKCTQPKEEVQKALKAYFEELNETAETLAPKYFYNMDETSIFFEFANNHTLELKSKKIVGKLSSGKDKKRITLIITACSNGSLLPPFIIFKAAKPRGKTYKDDPKDPKPKLDKKTWNILNRYSACAVHNYSGWNNARIMTKHYIPFFKSNAVASSLMIMDNHSSHCCNDTVEALEDQSIAHLFLAPNTTPITQPVDIQIGRSIKARIRRSFEDWLIENEAELISYDAVKKKYRFLAPSDDQIIEWVLKAYEETDSRLIMQSKLFCDLFITRPKPKIYIGCY